MACPEKPVKILTVRHVKNVVIERFGFFVNKINLKKSRCTGCGTIIEGVGLP